MRTKKIVNKMWNNQSKAHDNIDQSQDRQKSRQKGQSAKLKIGDKVLVYRTDLQTNFSAKLMVK